MVVAESTRDEVDGEGPFALEALDREVEGSLRPWPMLDACTRAGISRRDIYLTTCVKCPYRTKAPLTKEIMRACSDEFLGAEIELVRPHVIWITGYHGAGMVAEHFRGCGIPRLDRGEAVIATTPGDWPHGRVLVLRSTHPADNTLRLDDLRTEAELVAKYARRACRGQ
jgi:uracil-DNA glycosylase family 4